MRFGLAMLLFAWAVLQAGPAAAAGSWRELRAQQQPERHERGLDRRREGMRPERSERQERHNRLSDEERRGLHRDLDKARREIYKPRRDR